MHRHRPSGTRHEHASDGPHLAGIYLGEGRLGPVTAGSEQGCLVLGPPRSGKTTSIVIPNVLAWPAGAVAVSTKPDVLTHSAPSRHRGGRCALFDPSGLTAVTDGIERVGWSPLASAGDWDSAVLVAEAMVGASRPRVHTAESAHWAERASALLAPLLHAAALEGASLERLVGQVNRRESDRALSVLGRSGAGLAADVLTGITDTDPRELSGIWSSAAGALAAYRTSAALTAAARPPLEPAEVVGGRATLYVVAPSDHQRLAAPVVAGLLRELRSAAARARLDDPSRPPVLCVLDELANIAPLHDLPTLVAEGGSQGIVTLACLQDLSQARDRWGEVADGFLSLFGAKVVLRGIGDPRSLQAISLLAGHEDRPVVSRPYGIVAALAGRATSVRTVRRLPRLPPELIANPPPGTATLVTAGRVQRVALTPFYLHSPWKEMAGIVEQRRSVAHAHRRGRLLEDRLGERPGLDWRR